MVEPQVVPSGCSSQYVKQSWNHRLGWICLPLWCLEEHDLSPVSSPQVLKEFSTELGTSVFIANCASNVDTIMGNFPIPKGLGWKSKLWSQPKRMSNHFPNTGKLSPTIPYPGLSSVSGWGQGHPSLLCFRGTFLRSSQRCGCMRSPGAAHTAAVEWCGFGELVLLFDWMSWIPKPIQARKYQNECRLMLCCYVLSCLLKLNIKFSMHVYFFLQKCVTYRQRAIVSRKSMYVRYVNQHIHKEASCTEK